MHGQPGFSPLSPIWVPKTYQVQFLSTELGINPGHHLVWPKVNNSDKKYLIRIVYSFEGQGESWNVWSSWEPWYHTTIVSNTGISLDTPRCTGPEASIEPSSLLAPTVISHCLWELWALLARRPTLKKNIAFLFQRAQFFFKCRVVSCRIFVTGWNMNKLNEWIGSQNTTKS